MLQLWSKRSSKTILHTWQKNRYIYILYPRSGPLRNFEQQVYLDPPLQFKVRMYKISTHKYQQVCSVRFLFLTENLQPS